MQLTLHRLLGYEGTKPVYGVVLASFNGNMKKCNKAAKNWIKDNPNVGNVTYKWEK